MLSSNKLRHQTAQNVYTVIRILGCLRKSWLLINIINGFMIVVSLVSFARWFWRTFRWRGISLRPVPSQILPRWFRFKRAELMDSWWIESRVDSRHAGCGDDNPPFHPFKQACVVIDGVCAGEQESLKSLSSFVAPKLIFLVSLLCPWLFFLMSTLFNCFIMLVFSCSAESRFKLLLGKKSPTFPGFCRFLIKAHKCLITMKTLIGNERCPSLN